MLQMMMKLPGMVKHAPQMSDLRVHTLRADDFPTWSQRRRALVKLLVSLKK